jgi:hypothetical protein
MNSDRMAKRALLALVGILALGLELNAQPVQSADQVLCKKGQMFAVRGGLVAAMTKPVTFPQNIVVFTNAAFRVDKGKERKLQDGQVLSADGMLTSPDGSIVPVIDHVAARKGQVFVCQDGERSVPPENVRLRDGSMVTVDGYRVPPGRSPVKLLDGQMFRMDGVEIPAKDTVTLRGGKVRVQKDGSPLDVEPGRSLMMNDGTKVFGDGTIEFSDGKTRKVAEGEIVTLQGVVRAGTGKPGY